MPLAPDAHASRPQGAAAQTPATVALIGRQAIVNGLKQVVGYELFNRSRVQSATAHTAASDVTLLFTALSHAGSEDVGGHKLMFVNCTHDSLSGGHLDLVNPQRVVLELPVLPQPTPEQVDAHVPLMQALQERGFHLAFTHEVLQPVYAQWLALADYLKIDLASVPSAQIEPLIHQAQRSCRAKLIAEKVETGEQYDAVSSQGVRLYQGYWFARPSLVQARMLSPAHTHIIQLINLVRRQASTDAIEEVLKKDAALAFNLMRLINSAGFGLERPISSLRQAIMLLGLKRLFRWAALLMTTARGAGAPPAVGQTAVVRGRLMELLALQTGASQDDADAAFVVGVFSLLDIMLGLPMEQALELLALPEATSAALLRHEGRMGDLLALARACEAHDEAQFDRAAQRLQLSSHQINMAHLQALAWPDPLEQE